jgi:hypothetical protein
MGENVEVKRRATFDNMINRFIHNVYSDLGDRKYLTQLFLLIK